MRILANPDDHGIFPIETALSLNPDYSIKGKIALVDADLLDNGTRHPNLAIMKLSAYFKANGCEVRLIEDYSELCFMGSYYGALEYDAVFISKVFDFTEIDNGLLELDNVFFGGTGFFFDHAPKLPDEIEHHMPDYHVYDSFIEHDQKHLKQKTYWQDYQDYSIGFATRGCFRQCKFCVNHNVKRAVFHSHISEWVDPERKGIYLWDDNIFGSSCWKQVFEELEATKKPYKFRQGLDLRLLTDEKAEMLSKSKYLGDFIFAFDHLDEAPIIEKKLKLWRKYCNKPTKLYVLAGFDAQDETEIVSVFKRIEILIRYGCLPYIMRHEKYLESPYKGMFTQIARWCNQPQFLKKLSFRQYVNQCQFYHKTDGTLCAPMKAMTEFESKFPEIAERYFDMEYLKQPYVIRRMKENEEKRKNRRRAK